MSLNPKQKLFADGYIKMNSNLEIDMKKLQDDLNKDIEEARQAKYKILDQVRAGKLTNEEALEALNKIIF